MLFHYYDNYIELVSDELWPFGSSIFWASEIIAKLCPNNSARVHFSRCCSILCFLLTVRAKEALQSCKADVDHLMSSFAGGVEAAPRLPTAGLNGFAPTVIYVDFPKKHATYRLLQDMQSKT